MSEEAVTIPLQVPDEFFNELDRRFDQMAQRAAQKFSNAMRGTAAPGGGGPAGSTPGGGSRVAGASSPDDDPSYGKRYGAGRGPGEQGGAAGFFGDSAGKIFEGAGAGFLATRGSSAQSPTVMADNAIMGAYQGGVSALKAGAQTLGGGIGMALGGPAGAVAGQALGGALGDFVQSQFNSIKDEMEVPKERGIARLKSVYGQMAASGVTTTAGERQQTIDFTMAIEQKRYAGEQQIERQFRETHPTSAAFGLAWTGG